ncbi:MAG: transglycosylase SLT domain-containing protein [Bacillota bacterium]
MRNGFAFHQSDGDMRGREQRRVVRYEQSDSRGQYPRPRDNSFAQPGPRVPAQPQAMQPQAAPPVRREEKPEQAVFTAGGAQYEQPKAPYVPGYMRAAYRQNAPQEPQAFDLPAQHADTAGRCNPYVVLSEKKPDPAPAVKRRTLIVLTIIAAVILAGMGLTQLIFSAQTQAVLAARAAAGEIIADKHPFGYRELIEREAYKNNLHPAFVAAIVLNESSFNPDAESYRGARGLMQMMPDTAQWLFDQVGGAAEYSFDLMYGAEMNVTYGCWYLHYLSEKFGGDPVLVAAAFHSGQTNVLNWLSNTAYSSDQKTIPLDKLPDGNTKAYVEKVLDAFAAYKRLYYDEVTA